MYICVCWVGVKQKKLLAFRSWVRGESKEGKGELRMAFCLLELLPVFLYHSRAFLSLLSLVSLSHLVQTSLPPVLIMTHIACIIFVPAVSSSAKVSQTLYSHHTVVETAGSPLYIINFSSL